MSAIDKKLFRDLSALRGQVITIALVVACGIASYITMRTSYDSLVHSRDHYYEQQRFADVFGSVRRAPEPMIARLQAIDGVARVDTRVVERVLVPMEGMPRPASGSVVGLSSLREASRLNNVYIKRGRQLDPARQDEVLLLDAFASAHGLQPGDRIEAVLNGTLRTLSIAGLALSPEYVLAMSPGSISYDPALVPVLWMNQRALQAAFQMEGGFNSFSLQLQPGAQIRAVLAETDRLMGPYGGFGAVARDKQASNYMLSGELAQLDNMAGFLPFIFLFVAALLVNVVLSRLVQLQRGQIAALKAVGYSNLTIGAHYLELVSVIVLLGAALGVGLGAWFGSAMTEMYTSEFFRFPEPHYRLQWPVVLLSVGLSVGSAVVGAVVAVGQVAALPPAEAMRPPAPAHFRRSVLESLGVWRWMSPSTRMAWREISRRPLRLLLSAVGISLATGLVVVSRSMWDAMDELMYVQFHSAMCEDISVTFSKPLSTRAISELEHLPGVHIAEGLRSVPVRFEAGHLRRDAALMGYPANMKLRRLVDIEGKRHRLPAEGVVLTSTLANILRLGVGDSVVVHLREGEWRSVEVVVVDTIEEAFGLQGHMSAMALNRVLGDSGAVNTAVLSVDMERFSEVETRLKAIPWIAAVASPHDFKRQFDEQSAAMIGVFTFITTLFAAIIAVGVIYNNARVALSHRSRDLASLQVLGFTRREIAGILFREQAAPLAIAIPLGLLVGNVLSQAMMSNVDPEAYRFPMHISRQTYLYAVAITVASAVLSALILRRKVYKLDLIGVLKTRE